MNATGSYPVYARCNDVTAEVFAAPVENNFPGGGPGWGRGGAVGQGRGLGLGSPGIEGSTVLGSGCG